MRKNTTLILASLIPMAIIIFCFLCYQKITSPANKSLRYETFQQSRLDFYNKNKEKLANLIHISENSIIDGYGYIYTRNEWLEKYPNSCTGLDLDVRNEKSKRARAFTNTVDDDLRIKIINEYSTFFSDEKSIWDNLFLSKTRSKDEYEEFKSKFVETNPNVDLEKIQKLLYTFDVDIAKTMYSIVVINASADVRQIIIKDKTFKSFQVHKILHKENYKKYGSSTIDTTRNLVDSSIGLICLDEPIELSKSTPETDMSLAILNYYKIDFENLTDVAYSTIRATDDTESSWDYHFGTGGHLNSAGIPVYQRMYLVPQKNGGFSSDIYKIDESKLFSNFNYIINMVIPFEYRSFSETVNSKLQDNIYRYSTKTESIKPTNFDFCNKKINTIHVGSNIYNLTTLSSYGGQITENEYIITNNKTKQTQRWRTTREDCLILTPCGIFVKSDEGKFHLLKLP